MQSISVYFCGFAYYQSWAWFIDKVLDLHFYIPFNSFLFFLLFCEPSSILISFNCFPMAEKDEKAYKKGPEDAYSYEPRYWQLKWPSLDIFWVPTRFCITCGFHFKFSVVER